MVHSRRLVFMWRGWHASHKSPVLCVESVQLGNLSPLSEANFVKFSPGIYCGPAHYCWTTLNLEFAALGSPKFGQPIGARYSERPANWPDRLAHGAGHHGDQNVSGPNTFVSSTAEYSTFGLAR